MTPATSPIRAAAAEFGKLWVVRHRLVLGGVAAAMVIAIGVALAGNRGQALTVLGAVAGFSPLIAGMLTMSGIVADDRESGLILMWYQKRGTLLRSYGLRYGINIGLLIAFILAVAIGVGIIGVSTGLMTPLKAVHASFGMLGFGLVPSAMVFAMSAWRVKRDSTVAFVLIMASLMLGVSVVFEQTGWASTVRAIVFPIDPLQVIAKAGPYVAADIRAFIIVVGQFLVWSAAGFAGLHALQRTMANGKT